MNLEIQSRLSFYRRLEEVEHKKGISLVRHIETGQIYVEKVLTQYDKSIYDWLQQSKLPYVPQIYECMEEDGTLYLIEEYIQGITLETYIEQFGCLDLDAASRVIEYLCRTLEKLHSHIPPIVHRDIKPTNVMLQGDFKKGQGIVSVYLIDFNTARVFDAERNRDTELIGTRGFAAPEQYGFSQSDARTDIYGLGVLLNYMLCGKLIRDGIYEDYPEVSQIIRKATQIDPEKRYQAAEKMLQALHQIPPSGAEDKTEYGHQNTAMYPEEQVDMYLHNENINSGFSDDAVTEKHKEKCRPSWTRFLPPGFREGKVLNMVVAAIYYIFWIYFCLTVEVKDHGEPLSGTWLYVNRFVYFMMFIITPFFWNNYLDVWNYFPLVRSPKKIWKLVGLFLYTVAWFFLVMFVFVIVEDIFR